MSVDLAIRPAPVPAVQLAAALRIFDDIPVRHGVVGVEMNGVLLRKGDVAVYDELARSLTEGLIEGGLYVIEYQSPRSGMSWELFRRHECTRVDVTRTVVAVGRSKNSSYPDHWYAHPICGSGQKSGGMFYVSDGPYRDQWHLRDKLIGEVVGVYRGRQFDVEVA